MAGSKATPPSQCNCMVSAQLQIHVRVVGKWLLIRVDDTAHLLSSQVCKLIYGCNCGTLLFVCTFGPRWLSTALHCRTIKFKPHGFMLKKDQYILYALYFGFDTYNIPLFVEFWCCWFLKARIWDMYSTWQLYETFIDLLQINTLVG